MSDFTAGCDGLAFKLLDFSGNTSISTKLGEYFDYTIPRDNNTVQLQRITAKSPNGCLTTVLTNTLGISKQMVTPNSQEDMSYNSITWEIESQNAGSLRIDEETGRISGKGGETPDEFTVSATAYQSIKMGRPQVSNSRNLTIETKK